jgi:hypothetical protein
MLLNKLKITPKDKFMVLITIFGVFIVILLYLLVFIPIETSLNRFGILDFEFAWKQERAEEIMYIWGSSGRDKQSLAISLDFIFIIGYVFVTYGLILLISRRLSGKFQNIGIFMALLGIVSGLFDVIENINLLLMLGTPTSVSSINPLIASISATFKFGILFTCICFFVLALIVLLIKKAQKK